MSPIRAAALAVALAICAWFALGIRQATDLNSANAILTRGDVTHREVAHAGSLLDAAATLNPDSKVDLLRGQVAVLENDRPRAVRITEDVVRREPMNVAAWLLLAEASRNVPEIKQAVAMVARLDPRLTVKRR